MDSDYEYEVESNLSDNESDPDTTTVFQTSELPD